MEKRREQDLLKMTIKRKLKNSNIIITISSVPPKEENAKHFKKTEIKLSFHQT